MLNEKLTFACLDGGGAGLQTGAAHAAGVGRQSLGGTTMPNHGLILPWIVVILTATVKVRVKR